MKTRLNKLDGIILDIYRDLYKNSTPYADFDELVENAVIDHHGRKVIDYMAYEIDDDLLHEIIESHIKVNKVRKYDKDYIRNSVLLGCSPKSKIKKNEVN